MSSLWDAVFIQGVDRTGPLLLNLSGTPYVWYQFKIHQEMIKYCCKPDDKWVSHMGLPNLPSFDYAIERIIGLEFRIPLVIELNEAMAVLQFLSNSW
jgi:hypothetical protein